MGSILATLSNIGSRLQGTTGQRQPRLSDTERMQRFTASLAEKGLKVAVEKSGDQFTAVLTQGALKPAEVEIAKTVITKEADALEMSLSPLSSLSGAKSAKQALHMDGFEGSPVRRFDAQLYGTLPPVHPSEEKSRELKKAVEQAMIVGVRG